MPRLRIYSTAEEALIAKRAKDLETNKERHKRWQEKNREKIRIKSAKERAARLCRIPPWANLKEIEDFYNNCPEKHHVDHIIPLRGKLVSGLHALENL